MPQMNFLVAFLPRRFHIHDVFVEVAFRQRSKLRRREGTNRRVLWMPNGMQCERAPRTETSENAWRHNIFAVAQNASGGDDHGWNVRERSAGSFCGAANFS